MAGRLCVCVCVQCGACERGGRVGSGRKTVCVCVHGVCMQCTCVCVYVCVQECEWV